MDEVLRFLKDNSTFYLATTEGSTPKVRPFGFVMEYDGRLCFCTNNQKDVYRQLTANPEFEICVASNTGEWLRLKGRAVFITNRESKKAALDVMPSLRRMYSEDDSIFEIFCASEAEATFHCFDKPPRTVKL
jgi:uncharacterized pyridoxamine 5'-phosphate oxidase family protein